MKGRHLPLFIEDSRNGSTPTIATRHPLVGRRKRSIFGVSCKRDGSHFHPLPDTKDKYLNNPPGFNPVTYPGSDADNRVFQSSSLH